jgi:hypothetical protein
LAGVHHLTVRKMIEEIRKEQHYTEGGIIRVIAGENTSKTESEKYGKN